MSGQQGSLMFFDKMIIQMYLGWIVLLAGSYSPQSTGSIPCFIKYSFAFEKCRQPKKPACTERGEGWAALSIKCFVSSINTLFSWANFPHNKNTTFFFNSEIFLITLSVNSLQ